MLGPPASGAQPKHFNLDREEWEYRTTVPTERSGMERQGRMDWGRHPQKERDF